MPALRFCEFVVAADESSAWPPSRRVRGQNNPPANMASSAVDGYTIGR